MIALLLEKRGDQVEIIEDVVKVIAQSFDEKVGDGVTA